MVFTGSCHVGLKIKVKAGVKACSKEGPPPPPPESGEAASEPTDHGVVTNSNARMLKRKRLTPPGSPALNKRPPRGESPHTTTTANGEPVEPLEPVPKKLAADLNAVNKQDVATKPEESVEPGTEAKLEKGIKALSNSNLQGDLQVSSGATAEAEAVAAARMASDGPKADGNASADVSVATGVKVSSSLATSSVMNQADEEKHHTIPSHAGRKELLSLIYN